MMLSLAIDTLYIWISNYLSLGNYVNAFANTLNEQSSILFYLSSEKLIYILS